MSVQVYDPIPGLYEHRSADCALHGNNVPHARLQDSGGPYACVACMLVVARALDEPPPPQPERKSAPPPPPPPQPERKSAPPPPPPASTRYVQVARTLRELHNVIGTLGKLCEAATGPADEREVCRRITFDLTHLDDAEPEFWRVHEYVLRERAHARAQGYSLGLSEGRSKANGNSVSRLYDTVQAKYETLLTIAQDIAALLERHAWTSSAWQNVRARLLAAIRNP